MTSMLLMIVVALMTFFFADAIFTPFILLLWKKFWLIGLKVQALFTKKNVMQAMVQSFVLTTKALVRLINKTIANWILPLLMTRQQRYWLHDKIGDIRRWIRWRMLRGWVRWRCQPQWIRWATLIPAIAVTAAVFVGSGFLLAGLFGVSFIVPWLGGLPLATILFLRQQIARLALYVFERLGLGPAINNLVNWLIDIIWWQTPKRMQRRFDAWWRRFKMRLRRWVIGPRRKVQKRMSDFKFGQAAGNATTGQATVPGDQPATEPAASGHQKTPSA